MVWYQIFLAFANALLGVIRVLKSKCRNCLIYVGGLKKQRMLLPYQKKGNRAMVEAVTDGIVDGETIE